MTQLSTKFLCLHKQRKFLKDCDDKLIQENVKVFEKELHVLKKEQDFIISSDNNFSDLLISEINADTVFTALSDDF